MGAENVPVALGYASYEGQNMTKTCRTCASCQILVEPERRFPAGLGECRNEQPQVVPDVEAYYGMYEELPSYRRHTTAAWPTMALTAWCREYEPKETT